MESSELADFAKGLPEGLLVPSNQIRILNSEAIGQGTVKIVHVYEVITHGNALYNYTGEFGVVYKAHLIKWYGHGMPQTVAVKTLRGTSELLSYFVLLMDCHHYMQI